MTMHVWLSKSPFLPTPAQKAANEAVFAKQKIDLAPVSVIFKNSAGTSLAAQVVRIDSDNRPNMNETAAGTSPKRKVIIFGIRNHPTLANTDIKKGYTFTLPEDVTDKYVVLDITRLPGEIQATAEVSR
jgi:hypothetical protein